MRLKFIKILDNLLPNSFCWADCVVWAIHRKSINPFSIDPPTGCIIESKQNGAYYCGKYVKGKLNNKKHE
jgi:hypothetical protein